MWNPSAVYGCTDCGCLTTLRCACRCHAATAATAAVVAAARNVIAERRHGPVGAMTLCLDQLHHTLNALDALLQE